MYILKVLNGFKQIYSALIRFYRLDNFTGVYKRI